MTGESEESPIGCFARACEELNDFAQSLRDLQQFRTVRTGADIRYYEDGWRLEKWVEAELQHASSVWAAWWLELGRAAEGWRVESHLAVSPDVLFVGLEERHATSVTDLERQLHGVIEDFKGSLVTNREFAEAVMGNSLNGTPE